MQEKSERFNDWGARDAQVQEGTTGKTREEMCKSLRVKTAPHHLPNWQPARRWDLSSTVSTNSLREPGSRFFGEHWVRKAVWLMSQFHPQESERTQLSLPGLVTDSKTVMIKCGLKPRNLWGFVTQRQWTRAPSAGWSRASSSKRGSQRSLNLSRSLRGKNTKLSLACVTGLMFALMVQKQWWVRPLESSLPFRRWHQRSFISHCHTLAGKDTQCHLRVFLAKQNNYTCC